MKEWYICRSLPYTTRIGMQLDIYISSLPKNKGISYRVVMAKHKPTLRLWLKIKLQNKSSRQPNSHDLQMNQQPCHFSSLADIPTHFLSSLKHWAAKRSTKNVQWPANTLLILTVFNAMSEQPYHFSSLAQADIRPHFLPVRLKHYIVHTTPKTDKQKCLKYPCNHLNFHNLEMDKQPLISHH